MTVEFRRISDVSVGGQVLMDRIHHHLTEMSSVFAVWVGHLGGLVRLPVVKGG